MAEVLSDCAVRAVIQQERLEPDEEMRGALIDAERFIANFMGEPDKSGVDPAACLQRIRDALARGKAS